VPDDGLAAGAVARLLGVSVTTLRTWHQRYGLGPSLHQPGQHRRYTADDVSRLRVMTRLTGTGVPAAEAARAAIAAGPGQPPTPRAEGVRAGGGHAIPIGRAGPAARGLARAAMRLDAATMRAVITDAIGDHGVVHTWETVLVPILVGIGARHAATRRLVEVEHLLSRSVSEALATVPRPRPGGSDRILLACADEEQHSLALEALAAALAERGRACRLLGARVPGPALVDAVRRVGPVGVVVWSHGDTTANPAQLEALRSARPRPLMIAAAGPGWSAVDVPAGVERPTSLTEALDLTVPLTEL
jgi:MerR family transcriptional regulator, light-induced transcriptional regulator